MGWERTWILAGAFAALAAGCSTSSRRATDPLPATPGLVQVGEISWYGIAERGRPTASGEAMDPDAMTAAHRTLPFGTAVEVTLLTTGRTIEVRINDRGPFIRGRILDLSHSAARELGIVRQGVARASVRVLGHVGPVRAFAVQVGAFRNLSGAERRAAALEAEDVGAVNVAPDRAGRYYQVRIPGFRTRDEAQGVARQLESRGYEAFVVSVPL